jgi:peptidoglycan/LPS O-acetylase OafA/YrhL
MMGLAFGLAVYAVCACESKIKRHIGHGWIERLGDYSYGLYLVHVAVLTTVMYVARHGLNGDRDRPIGNWVCLIALAAALTSGWWYGKVDLALHGYFKRWTSLAKIKQSISIAREHAAPAVVVNVGGDLANTARKQDRLHPDLVNRDL